MAVRQSGHLLRLARRCLQPSLSVQNPVLINQVALASTAILSPASPFFSHRYGQEKSLDLLTKTKVGVLFEQRRGMFIQTQDTPNPASLMFMPGCPVMPNGSFDFANARAAMSSPLATSLFRIDGVTRVFYGSDYITVSKNDDISWAALKPEVFAAIMDFFSSEQPLFAEAQTATSAANTAIHESDDEVVAMIKELLETRIRPAVQDDGGDIYYRGFDPDTGVVKLKMQGACRGCPSSAVTLKSGIENMLMHYVPEVTAVEQDEEDEDAEIG